MATVPDITIEQYLQRLLINYTISDEFIEVVEARLAIPAGSPAFQRDENGNEDPAWVKKRELATADVYFAASTFINGGGSSKQLGNRRFTEMNVQVSAADRAYWRELANRYYRKYGEAIPEPADIYDASGLWGAQDMGGWNCGSN